MKTLDTAIEIELETHTHTHTHTQSHTRRTYKTLMLWGMQKSAGCTHTCIYVRLCVLHTQDIQAVEDAKKQLAARKKQELEPGFVKVVQIRPARGNATHVGP